MDLVNSSLHPEPPLEPPQFDISIRGQKNINQNFLDDIIRKAADRTALRRIDERMNRLEKKLNSQTGPTPVTSKPVYVRYHNSATSPDTTNARYTPHVPNTKPNNYQGYRNKQYIASYPNMSGPRPGAVASTTSASMQPTVRLTRIPQASLSGGTYKVPSTIPKTSQQVNEIHEETDDVPITDPQTVQDLAEDPNCEVEEQDDRILIHIEELPVETDLTTDE